MILKSITLIGFKSFAKKTIIDVSKNVTGIVGPNGSGKSNIAEAIRFVMGEQSMKSIRSKSASDLVWKGSNYIGPLSRASVSIEIDNKLKDYNEGVSPELAKFLSYDEIILSREVFTDGGSVYKINASEVRLKDVQSLLALAGIGASAHTIISQGEADKILIASPKDRKEMIEDSLGLKIHQIRLKDSERKLKKVEDHMKVADLMCRELRPELTHLSILMEKINKVEIEREKLFTAYLDYFSYEQVSINDLKKVTNDNKNIQSQIEENKTKLSNLKNREAELSSNYPNQKVEEYNKEITSINENRFALERELSIMLYEKNNLFSLIKEEIKEVKINKKEWIEFKRKLEEALFQLENDNKNSIYNPNNISVIKDLLSSSSSWISDNDNENIKSKIEEVEKDIVTIEDKIQKEKTLIAELQNKIKLEQEEKLNSVKHIYNDIYIIEKEINNLESEKKRVSDNIFVIQNREKSMLLKLEEAFRFVGQKVLSYKTHNITEEYKHYENEKSIERLKIRIEEIGILDPTSIKNNYEEVNGRFEFLQKEIDDLTKTKDSLDEIITNLKNSIKNDFEKGLQKINFAFANLFHEIFPGGRASIFVEKVADKNIDEEDEDTQNMVEGINLNISLPSKKVSDINMLSGGEKTLSSIALLFALTSITPPPFMVLDETDAALDEMNARKYGKLLSRLAEKSRLLVITHNRETMNECDVLYGVTVGGDGSSKILSIKFD
ncbi:MAG: chromosome segregation protein [Patescibacteria group bacterium]|nr:chromosome segregation protein [Patescibacteria group bacterium]